MQDSKFTWKQTYAIKINKQSLINLPSPELLDKSNDQKTLMKDHYTQRDLKINTNQLLPSAKMSNEYYLPSLQSLKRKTQSKSIVKEQRKSQFDQIRSLGADHGSLLMVEDCLTSKTEAENNSKLYTTIMNPQVKRLKTGQKQRDLKIIQINTKIRSIELEREDLASHMERRKFQNKLLQSEGYCTSVNDKILDDQKFLQSLSQTSKLQAKSIDGVELKKYTFLQEKLIATSQDQFNTCYKSMNRVKQLSSMYDLKPNVFVQMLQISDQYDLKPKRLGVIPSSSKQVLHFHSSSTIAKNKNYLEMLMKGVNSDTAYQLDLQNNMLISINMKTIVDNFPQQLIYLDLSHNQIDQYGVIFFQNVLKSPYNLQYLNLEHNRLGDQGVTQLALLLQSNRTITSINLSANHLTNQCTASLGQYIRKSKMLLELYVAFNSINGEKSLIFWKAIAHCVNLRVLDVSHNSIGGKNILIARKIAKIIQKPHPCLSHLDLSYNQFNEAESIFIAIALGKNHQIYGFHFQGNDINFYVDVAGFLKSRADDSVHVKPPKKKIYVKTEIHVDNKNSDQIQPEFDFKLIDQKIERFTLNLIKDQDFKKARKIDGVRALPSQLRVSDDPVLRDPCWICDGFQEHQFIYVPNESGQFTTEPIYVHLSFQQYKPQLMIKDQKQDRYLFRVMCPAQLTIKYFFSNPLLQAYGTARDQLIIETPPNDVLLKERIKLEYVGNKHQDVNERNQKEYLIPFIKMKCKKLQFVNSYQTKQIKTGLWNQTQGRYILDDLTHYLPLITCLPREDEVTYNMSNLLIKKQKAPWTVEKSIFNTYFKDTDVLVNNCFEFDFEGSKINKICKDPQELANLKECLRGYYKYLFRVYKYYTSSFTNSSIPCISMNAMSDFISKTMVVDSKKLKSSDVDILFVSTNAQGLGYQYVVEKCLIRYQFLEIIVRIAQDKYLRNVTNKSPQEIFNKTGQQNFRTRRNSQNFDELKQPDVKVQEVKALTSRRNSQNFDEFKEQDIKRLTSRKNSQIIEEIQLQVPNLTQSQPFLEQQPQQYICNNITDAVRRIFVNDKVVQWIDKFDSAQEWRDERFWNHECELILKAKNNEIKALFDYAEQINAKKQYYKFKWMSQKDFHGLISEAGFVNDSFGEKEIYLAFLLSKMTQVDEVNYTKHSQMTLNEFYEALARVSEKLSLSPTSYKNLGLEDMDLYERRLQPLHIKLEALINILFERLQPSMSELRASKGLKALKFGTQNNDDSESNSEESADSFSIITESLDESSVAGMSPKQKTNTIESDDNNQFIRKSMRESTDYIKMVDLSSEQSTKIIRVRNNQIHKTQKFTKEPIDDVFSLVTVLKYLAKNKIN